MARYPKRKFQHAPIYVELPLAHIHALKDLQRARVVERGGQQVHLRELIQEAVENFLRKHRVTLPDIEDTRELEAQREAQQTLIDARKTLAEHQRKLRKA